jgi:DNA-binding CsgD family transcriptional regulator
VTVRALDIDALILKIHSAPLQWGGWTAVASELIGFLRADSAALLRISSDPHTIPWVLPVGFDSAALDSYGTYWASRDLWHEGARREGRLQGGVVSVDDQLVRRPVFLRSAYFNECLKQYDLNRMMNLCLLTQDPNRPRSVGGISFYRGIGKEAFSAADAALLGHLSPHLIIAATNSWRVEALQLRQSVSQGALDAVTGAVFAINRDGSTLFTNMAAETLLRRSQWVQVVNGKLLPSTSLRSSSAFTAALRQLADGIGSTTLLTERLGSRQATMHVIPFAEPLSTVGQKGAIIGLIWLVPVVSADSSITNMIAVFRLTGAEGRLLRRLVEGDDLASASAFLGISIHTARAQLKSILHKTGKRSQGQLMALVSRVGMISTTEQGGR